MVGISQKEQVKLESPPQWILIDVRLVGCDALSR